MFKPLRWAAYIALFCFTSIALNLTNRPAIATSPTSGSYQHVLILSVDGLRQADVADPAFRAHLTHLSTLAQKGVSYTNAFASSPSDSFPGTLNYLTGASPKLTGVYYDDSYDRLLAAPGETADLGTEVLYDESIDKDDALLSGGGDFGAGSLDPAKLPQRCDRGTCTPVYPHSYLKVNTIFEVAKAAGLHTAFMDKHPAYDLANGPSGTGVADLFTPEINAKVAIENGKLVDRSTAINASSLNFTTATKKVQLTEAYDDLKVDALVNQIKGMNAFGTTRPGVPALFAMNFQAVSVAQKDRAAGGIAADGTPSPVMVDAIDHTDASIGRILAALEQNNLGNSTLVVVTAKHGQTPRLGTATLIFNSLVADALKAAGIEVAQATQDTVSMVWLKNQQEASKAAQVLESYKASHAEAGIDRILSGDRLTAFGFGNPLNDSRTPDLMVVFQPDRVAVDDPTDSNKRAEHGGFSEDETHVALIVGSNSLPAEVKGTTQTDMVCTTQVAVTALAALGLDPNALQGAKAEGTQPLPGLIARR